MLLVSHSHDHYKLGDGERWESGHRVSRPSGDLVI